FMQAIAVTVAGRTNKGRLADPRQRRVPDDRDALLLLALIQQNFGSLCRELATTAGLIDPIRAGRFQKGRNILFFIPVGRRLCSAIRRLSRGRASRKLAGAATQMRGYGLIEHWP